MKYFCKQWGNEIGPLSSNDIRAMASSRAIQPDHFIRAENSSRWVTADSIPNLFLEISSYSIPLQQAEIRGLEIRKTSHRFNPLVCGLAFSTFTLTAVLAVLILKPFVQKNSSQIASRVAPASPLLPTSPKENRSNGLDSSDSAIVSNEKQQPLPGNVRPMLQPPLPQMERPAPPPPPAVYKTGELAIVSGLSYAVALSAWSNSISKNSIINVPPRASYLIVGIVVINVNREAYLLPPLHLVDENGTEYSPSPHSLRMENALGPVENLNPEVPVTGLLLFDVPRKHTYRLKVRAGLWSTEHAYILLEPDENSREIGPHPAVQGR